MNTGQNNDDDLYDEFGNYLGPEVGQDSEDSGSSSNEEDNSKSQDDDSRSNQPNKQPQMQQQQSPDQEMMYENSQDEEYYQHGHQIVLHEDKQYYPDAEQIYGPGVEALVVEEDAQPLTTPIVQPVRENNFQVYDKTVPETVYESDYFSAMSTKPELMRNVCIAGAMHHGKTLLADMFYQQAYVSHEPQQDSGKAEAGGTGSNKIDPRIEYKYTDNRRDEIARQMSLKVSCLSLLLKDSRDKFYYFNLADTPGHPGFSDEVTVGMRLSDGVILVVDVIEGVGVYTERLIKEAISNKLPIVVVINKIDRLVLELKMPPADAYYKLKHTLDELNNVVRDAKLANKADPSGDSQQRGCQEQEYFSPLNNNVAFASTLFGCCFTTQSFAKTYMGQMPSKTKHSAEALKGKMSMQGQITEDITFTEQIDAQKFSRFLWGDLFYNPATRKFQRQPTCDETGGEQLQRSFVHHILEPFYKVVLLSLNEGCSDENGNSLESILKKRGIKLTKKEYSLDIKPLIRLLLRKILGDVACLVDQMVSKIPCVKDSRKFERIYPGDLTVINADNKQAQPLFINIVKLFNNEQDKNFISYGRILSGQLQENQTIKILTENYNPNEPSENCYVTQIGRIWIMQAGGRHKIQVSKASQGMWIGIENIDQFITKTATIVDLNLPDPSAFLKLNFQTEATLKLALEPLNPSDLPKMLEGLRSLNKAYPILTTKVEESGEHQLQGTSELQLDQALHDLRNLYAERVEIKISEPFVQIGETVAEQSAVPCFSLTPNKKNKITMVAEPMDKGLVQLVQKNQLFLAEKRGVLQQTLIDEFGWDELTATQGVWAFGPLKQSGQGSCSNMLLDYTVEDDDNQRQYLQNCRPFITQGFQWAAKEGPLTEEPMQNVKYKVIESELAKEPVFRSGGQIIPTARRAAYSSFLLASPRIMEPMFLAEVVSTSSGQDTRETIYSILNKRRAHVIFEEPKPGAPLLVMRIEIPAMEIVGFETDLRTHTMGQAMVLSMFSHWTVLPGDPLDRKIELRPLEPSAVPELARELLVKIRRRKGLLENVSVAKYFDSADMTASAKEDPYLKSYF